MNMRPLSLLIIVCGLALAACSGAGDSLNGTSWELASVDGAAALPDVKATASFTDGQVSGSGGCNSYGGKYEVRGDKIQFSEVIRTLMACGGEGVMDQEEAFLGSLEKAESFRLSEGKLEIITSDGKTLAFAPAD